MNCHNKFITLYRQRYNQCHDESISFVGQYQCHNRKSVACTIAKLKTEQKLQWNKPIRKDQYMSFKKNKEYFEKIS